MLSERLKQLRASAGLTAADVARHLGVSRAAVAMWETGQSRPTTDRVGQLARLFGLDDVAELELYRLAAAFTPEAA